jgi:hypothetical protein
MRPFESVNPKPNMETGAATCGGPEVVGVLLQRAVEQVVPATAW